MSVYGYVVATWLLLFGAFGIMRSRNLLHAILSLAVSQSGTYVLLISVGYQRKATPPIYGEPPTRPTIQVVDPVVQALTLTDIVVSATVTALLLALAIQIHKRHGTLNPDELRKLRG